MCGVVGVIGSPSRVNRQMFQDMLCMGAKRGPHSTGIVAATRKNAYVLKDVGLPWDLLRTQEYADNIIGKNWPVMMGHNRWATMGKVIVDNAHPFWHEHIILMHNGTLDKQSDKLAGWWKFDTDSEAVAHSVATIGIKETYKLIQGAWTFVWWDQRTGMLNVITNGQRPFNFLLSDDKRSMFWASEDWIIRFAADARGVKLDKTLYTLTTHTLYQFFLNKKGTVEFTTEVLEGKPHVPFVWTGGTKGGHYLNAAAWDEDEEIGNYLGYSSSTSNASGSDAQKNLPRPETTDGSSSTGAGTAGTATETTVMGPKKNQSLRLFDDKGQPVVNQTIFRPEPVFGPAKQVYKTYEAYKEKHNHESCALCGAEVGDEYETALILDPETVACGTCHAFCDLNDVKLV